MLLGVIASTILLLPEVLQDSIFCEACDFLGLSQLILANNRFLLDPGGGGPRRRQPEGGDVRVTKVAVSGLLIGLILLFVATMTLIRCVHKRSERTSPPSTRPSAAPRACSGSFRASSRGVLSGHKGGDATAADCSPSS